MESENPQTDEIHRNEEMTRQWAQKDESAGSRGS
jgi:hypothetical protein